MKETFAHEAVVEVTSAADARAPGAGITVELCGHWEHEGPCTWPHHTEATPSDGALRLRTLFACEPDEESDVRRRIDAALARGQVTRPDGGTAAWQVRSGGPSEVLPTEIDHARRLASQ